jgi:hypothetical protein
MQMPQLPSSTYITPEIYSHECLEGLPLRGKDISRAVSIQGAKPSSVHNLNRGTPSSWMHSRDAAPRMPRRFLRRLVAQRLSSCQNEIAARRKLQRDAMQLPSNAKGSFFLLILGLLSILNASTCQFLSLPITPTTQQPSLPLSPVAALEQQQRLDFG